MDINTIIADTMAVAREPETVLTNEETTLNNQISAWQAVNTLVLSLNTDSATLSNPDTYNAKTVTSSDSSLLTATADKTSSTGQYYVTVNSLATSQQLISQGYSDTSTSALGTGTVSVQVGTGKSINVTLDSTNDTLTGLCSAINNASAGVTASVINDGSSSNSYHLLLTSNTGGTGGEMTITSNLSGGTSPTLTEMQAATNSSVTLGQGSGAITVTGNSNTLTNVIPGVTLNLNSADKNTSVTLNISSDTSSIGTDIATWIDDYNNLMDDMTTQFTYDTTTQTSGTLFGDGTLESMQSELQNMIGMQVTGASSSACLLSQIGITTDDSNNHLDLDATTLESALSDGGSNIQKLFSTVATPTSSDVSYVTSTSSTKASGTNGYAVVITQAATHSSVTAGVAQTDDLAANETLTVNGTSIDLTAGMTQAQVITAINAQSNTTGVVASATGSDGTGTGNYLTLMSVGYGSSQKVSVQSTVSNGGSSSSTTDTSGIGDVAVTQADGAGEAGTGTAAAGLNVAGTINGETATGTGQMLTGSSGNANTAGLTLQITATSAGSYGTVALSKGIASLMSDYTSSVTDSTTGIITTTESSLSGQVTDLQGQVTDMETLLSQEQDNLTTEYANMESALGTLKNQQSYLNEMFNTNNNNNSSSSSSSSS
jgi:flagellar hook-associated protein 2